jgi:hypothetical protein
MESVFVFSAVEPRLIRDGLDGIAQRTSEDSWVLDERMWIRMQIPPDWTDGFESERAEIERHLGKGVALIAADVGKANSIEDVRRFAISICALGLGLAFDDYTHRGWTAEELAADETIDGRKFFSGDATIGGAP